MQVQWHGSPGQLGLRVTWFLGHWVAGSQNDPVPCLSCIKWVYNIVLYWQYEKSMCYFVLKSTVIRTCTRYCRELSTTSRSQWRWLWLLSRKVCLLSSRRVWLSALGVWPRRTRSCEVCRRSRLLAARRSSALTRLALWPPTRCPSVGWAHAAN